MGSLHLKQNCRAGNLHVRWRRTRCWWWGGGWGWWGAWVPSPGRCQAMRTVWDWVLASAQVLCILGKVVLGGAIPARDSFQPTGSFIKIGLSAAELLVPLRNKTDVWLAQKQCGMQWIPWWVHEKIWCLNWKKYVAYCFTCQVYSSVVCYCPIWFPSDFHTCFTVLFNKWQDK